MERETNLRKKNKVEEIILPDVKAYYSYNNQDSMVFAEVQIHRSTE